MSDPNSAADLSHLEAHALLLEQDHQRRRVLAIASTVPGAAYVFVALMAERPVVTAMAAVLVGASALTWGWLAWRDRGRDGRIRRAWRAWLAATSWRESVDALVVVFHEYHPASDPSAARDLGVRDLEALREAALDGHVVDLAVLYSTVHDLLLAELAQRVEAARAEALVEEARREAEEIVKGAQAERAEILRRANRTAADYLAAVARGDAPPAFGAASPPFGLDGRAEELRTLFESAAREAARGAVRESPAAAEILTHPGRWSAYAPPRPVSEALLALFDPVHAAIPPPPKGVA